MPALASIVDTATRSTGLGLALVACSIALLAAGQVLSWSGDRSAPRRVRTVIALLAATDVLALTVIVALRFARLS